MIITNPSNVYHIHLVILDDNFCHIYPNKEEADAATKRFASRGRKSIRGHSIAKSGKWTRCDVDAYLTVEPLRPFAEAMRYARHRI
jgi:hypothetical protein